MREVEIAGIRTSVLGFGCASLGSRVSETDGLRALEAAHGQGVSWFDVAPAYGAGQAEDIVGRFIARVGRENVGLCTKVGLVPPAQGPLTRLARRIARPLVSAAAPLRAAVRASKLTANRAAPLTPDLVRTSLERSLGRLRTDHVEVYALHNAQEQDLENEGVMRALEDLRKQGKIRAVAVAGGLEVARAVLAREAGVDVVQLAQHREAAPLEAIRASGRVAITHSVFGVAGSLAGLTRRLASDRKLRARLEGEGFAGPPAEAAAALLLARAFASNSAGIVLASMVSERSRAQNIAAAGQPPMPAALQICSELGV